MTTRGGSPRVCLEDGCGATPVALPSEGVLNDEVALNETRDILKQARLTTSPRGGDATLEDAIKRFQARPA